MNVCGSVFKLSVRFCVWHLSSKNILFFIFNRPVNNAQFFSCQVYVCNGTNKRMHHTEFSFLPVSKAIKAVSCITDFGVSTAISGELQYKTYKEVYFSSRLVFFSTIASHRLKMNNFLCRNLNHPNLFLL